MVCRTISGCFWWVWEGHNTTQHKAVSVVELRDLDSNVNESVDVLFGELN